MKIVNVWIELNNMKLNKTFSYCTDNDNVSFGKRVAINFNNREIIGFVDSVIETDETQKEISLRCGFEVKMIDRLIDEEALISPELYELAKWMSYNTLSPMIACLQAMLPSKIKPKSSKQTIKYEKWIVLTDNHVEQSLTIKQAHAYEELIKRKEILYKEWNTKYSNFTSALVNKGLAQVIEKEASYNQVEDSVLQKDIELSYDQKEAMNKILNSDKNTILLHGVTGSGKTEIYLQLARKTLSEGKQALILVPEISLTPQMVKRVKERFGDAVAIYHSGLNPQEKYEQYKRIKNREVNIVVGTRSAVFMPFSDLGLIVMDEEHDSSYKQDSTPFYHCRDICIKRASTHACKLILGSATPSLDSYARALRGVYDLVELNNRINLTVPKVKLINTKETMKSGQGYLLTNPLKEHIQTRIDNNEQVILLLNRRGYSPILKCSECGEVLMCPNCDVALSYHKEDNCLKCHVCGFTHDYHRKCDKCGSLNFIPSGFGTQRLYEEVRKCFPDVKLFRMDADTTTTKNAHEKILSEFEVSKPAVLIGTQMIAKGLDYPDVTLVGIINGDAGLNHTDFRSVETTFHLIVQASGRSGRSEKEGEVLIQAFDPKHYAITLGAKTDYKSFFKKEMEYRKLSSNPPYTYIISIVFSDVALNSPIKEARELVERLKKHQDIKVLGPSEIGRMINRYRVRVVIKGKNLDDMINLLQDYIEEYRLKGRSNISVDVNPLHLD